MYKKKMKIAVLGAGESGLSAALLAHNKGYQVFVSDAGAIKPTHVLALTDNHIAFEQNGHDVERILKCDKIIKSPGIADSTPIIQAIKELGIPIISEIEFAFQYVQGKIIAITGSNGKTTTSYLTYHLLQQAGYNVALCGNVGESLARKVLEKHYDYYVVELSSFQLDYMFDFKADISILLNITEDHLDRYDYQFSKYIHSKFRILQNQSHADAFIYWQEDPIIQSALQVKRLLPELLPFALETPNQTAYFDAFSSSLVFPSMDFAIEKTALVLQGKHNYMNIMAAVLAAHRLGVQNHTLLYALGNFVNVPHRLELLDTLQGVAYINDSKATNVDSAWYALDSQTKPIVWIVGGVDKGNDYNKLLDLVKQKVKAIVMLGKDNEKIQTFFSPFVKEIYDTHSIADAVLQAQNIAQTGDVVLLSPACASFDLFNNYEHRGACFKQEVCKLSTL